MKYERLSRSRGRIGKFCSVWLGDDHLLSVESNGYSENYMRYYFKDIQAISTIRTVAGNAWNAAYVALIVIILFPTALLYDGDPSIGIFTAGIFALLFFVLLAWNLFSGPTCRCYVHMQVGIEQIPGLDRIKTVKAAIVRLRPFIAECQGTLSHEEIVEWTAVTNDRYQSPDIKKIPPVAQSVTTTILDSTYRGGFHRAAFSLLIVDGAISTIQILYSPKFLGYISTGLTYVFLILAIIALVKQAKHLLPSSAKWMLWGGVAVVLAGMISGIVFAGFFLFENIQSGIKANSNTFDLATLAAAHPVFAIYLLVYALFEAVIGITGLISLGRGRGVAGRRQP